MASVRIARSQSRLRRKVDSPKKSPRKPVRAREKSRQVAKELSSKGAPRKLDSASVRTSRSKLWLRRKVHSPKLVPVRPLSLRETPRKVAKESLKDTPRKLPKDALKSIVKDSPQKLVKRRSSGVSDSEADPKRARPADSYEAIVSAIRLERPKQPAGEAWPVHDLRAFDAPTEDTSEINYGPLLKEVLLARGWKYSTKPCHGVYDEKRERATIYVKEFEASLLGAKPEKVFGKQGAVAADGYRMKEVPLPKHALWMMGRLPYHVPGTAKDATIDREDFINIVVKHGSSLPGKAGNYRMAKFPGTETLLFKTNFTQAFKTKPWYPTTYILPKEKEAFLEELKTKGDSRTNMWIGKPRNDYGGTGICVWKGVDKTLLEQVETATERSVMQRYLADPLLVGGYKFHMRIHLVITNVEPVEAYVQENGQCLFATKPYTTANKTLGKDFDPPVHVTNMGLNATPANKENFFREKPIVGRGQQIRMRQLMSHLAETQPTFNKRWVWQQIIQIAKESALYLSQGIKRQHKIVRDRHFEIFGMDLMLDKNFKVWMCEVNTDPGLSYPDDDVLGDPNPDYKKEFAACSETFHDLFALLGLDASRPQTQGSLKSWFKVDCSQ